MKEKRRQRESEAERAAASAESRRLIAEKMKELWEGLIAANARRHPDLRLAVRAGLPGEPFARIMGDPAFCALYLHDTHISNYPDFPQQDKPSFKIYYSERESLFWANKQVSESNYSTLIDEQGTVMLVANLGRINFLRRPDLADQIDYGLMAAR